MSKTLGTVVRGIKAPIFKAGDDVVKITTDIVLNAIKENNIQVQDKDIVAITESVIARCQGNYVTTEDIAIDVRNKVHGNTVGLVWPILSRNRFSLILKGIASAVDNVVIMLSYPEDEVGNKIVNTTKLDDNFSKTLSEKQFIHNYGSPKHMFTGVNYLDLYREIVEGVGANCRIIFSNRLSTILKYTDNVIDCTIHTRQRNKTILRNLGAKVVLGLDDILTSSINGSGYNDLYGVLGSNKADDDRLKLFPRDCMNIAEQLMQSLSSATGKQIEAMVYGDGAFRDPVGKIWELADPVVSPGYTQGLFGTPNEMKLKYLADNEFKDLSGDELTSAIKNKLKQKSKYLLKGNMLSEGTTPRNITDLLGSLCDLTSGSGDKGTPIIYIQGYFDNYTSE